MVRKLVRKRYKEPGSAPGVLVAPLEALEEPVSIARTIFDAESLDEQDIGLEQIAEPLVEGKVTWFDVVGLKDVEVLRGFGSRFRIHPLALDDITNTDHRVKMEEYPHNLFLVFKMLHWNEGRGEVQSEQVSVIVGEGYILSFQERAGDVFGPVRERLRKAAGRIRTAGADYLAFALLRSVVDNYYVVMEEIGEQIETLETEVLENAVPEHQEQIYRLKRELIYLRKSLWPLREIAMSLSQEGVELISDSARFFYRDLSDHATHQMENLQMLRDTMAGILDLYLSTVSNRMNEVMKVLTIIATIFIPITFVAGVYGMNFEHMPELDKVWAYPAAWFVFVAVAVGMLIYFRKKRWL